MGQRGPAPRPTELNRYLGNPGHRKLETDEPKPARAMPSPPEWLNAVARGEWDRVVGALFEIGVLTAADGTSLAAYCVAYGRWVECEQAITENGITMTGRWGETLRPEVAAAQKYLGIIKQYTSEFGLSPSARARMVLPAPFDQEEDDGLD